MAWDEDKKKQYREYIKAVMKDCIADAEEVVQATGCAYGTPEKQSIAVSFFIQIMRA